MTASLPLYVLRRLAWTFPTLLLVGLMVFVLMRLVPGDPALLILGDSATPEQLSALRADYGLDKPIPIQFFYALAIMLVVTGVVPGPIVRSRVAAAEELLDWREAWRAPG